jgi:signal transduction histidine kinase/CheY-like chemotaxis protein
LKNQEETWKKRLEREKNARKQAEKLLEEKSLELYIRNAHLKDISENQELLINHRTSELLNALSEAKAANHTKREFFANVSHELRTPLNGILGMAHMMLDTNLNNLQKDYTQTILISSEILLNLINDILDFSKIEAGKLELEETDFDLSQMLYEVLDILSSKANEKQIDLLLKYEPNLPNSLKGDPNRLKQILLNLGSNAIKFTEKGKVVIEVKQIKSSKKYSELKFEISDSGIGIPKQKLKLLFNPFTQADASTNRKFGGTGLGLSISKKLVEMMSGEIGVKSELDKGSTFWFTTKLETKNKLQSTIDGPPVLFNGYEAYCLDTNEESNDELIKHLNAWNIKTKKLNSITGINSIKIKPKTILFIGNENEEAFLNNIQDNLFDKEEFILKIFLSKAKNTKIIELAKEKNFNSIIFKPLKFRQIQLELSASLNAIIEQKNTENKKSNKGNKINSDLNILIVEDNLINQKVALALLNKFGFKAKTADNGLIALQKMKEEIFDLIFMDFQMPELDGYETTGRIRNGQSGICSPKIPIIAMTANAMKGDQEKCLIAGMNDFLSKPIIPAELEELLQKWVDIIQQKK